MKKFLVIGTYSSEIIFSKTFNEARRISKKNNPDQTIKDVYELTYSH